MHNHTNQAIEQPPYQGRELVLKTREFAVETPWKSWFYVLSTFFLTNACLFGTLFIEIIPVQIALSVLAGLLLVRSFVLYHDYQHGSILRESLLARALMAVFGVFILAPASVWKKTHNHHHKHNSKLTNHGIGDYPLLEKQTFLRLSKSNKKIYLFQRHPMTIFFGYITVFFFDFNVRSLINNPKDHFDTLLALIIHVGLSVGLVAGFGVLNWIFFLVIPFTIACGMGSYLFYVQHNFPGASFNETKDWNYFEAALQSSSQLDIGRLMNWFTANIGFHHIHHVNPLIPFYNLPETKKAIPQLQNPKTIGLSPKDIIACLRLKVWDKELGQMTSL